MSHLISRGLSRKNLRLVSIRSATAIALRAIYRAGECFPNVFDDSGERQTKFGEQRLVFNVGRLLIESFLLEELSCDSSKLAELMKDKHWETEDDEELRSGVPIIDSGLHLLSGVTTAYFFHPIDKRVAKWEHGTKFLSRCIDSLRLAHEAVSMIDTRLADELCTRMNSDFDHLRECDPYIFPSFGVYLLEGAPKAIEEDWKARVSQRNSLSTSEDRVVLKSSKMEKKPCTEESIVSPEGGKLYKYVSFNTLKRICDRRALRFSRLTDFNDPFDGQLLPVRKFGPKAFREAILDAVRQAILADQCELSFNYADQELNHALDEEISKAAKSENVVEDMKFCLFPKPGQQGVASVAQILRALILLARKGEIKPIGEAMDGAEKLLKLFDDEPIDFSVSDGERLIVDSISQSTRVLCLSENPRALLMWSHYSDQHTGAVLEFDIEHPKAAFLRNAKPVRYSDRLPSFVDASQAARLYLGDIKAIEHISDRQFFTKSDCWQYEREWRVLGTDFDEFVTFDLDCISAIFLGCRVNMPRVEEILATLSEAKMRPDVFFAEKDDEEFALNFLPLSNGRFRSGTSVPNKVFLETSLRWCLDFFFRYLGSSNGSKDILLQRVQILGLLKDFGSDDALRCFNEMVNVIDEGIEKRKGQPSVVVGEHGENDPSILLPLAKAYKKFEDSLQGVLSEFGARMPPSKH